jgi:hypothetical protein
MNRRPPLLVLLAIAYAVSPLVYPVIVSLAFGDPILDVLRQLYQANSPLRNFEVFVLPFLLGLCFFLARRTGYFFIVVCSIYLFVRNLFVFASTDGSFPAHLLVFLNLLLLASIIYLSRKSTRSIYFDPKLRWWETDPRYRVDFPGTLTRLGGSPITMRIRNIAIGGAAIETSGPAFLPHERILIDFEANGQTYRCAAGVVWEENPELDRRLAGLQWTADPSASGPPPVKDLIRRLKADRTPTTSEAPSWWQDLRAWIEHSR